MYNNQAPNTGYGGSQYQNGGYGGYGAENQGQDPENFQDEGYAQPGAQPSSQQQQYNPQLQRSLQQQQGLKRSAQTEQALGPRNTKEFEKEERRQNLLCCLFLTLGLVLSAVVAMAIFLSIWLTQDDDVNTIVNNTISPPEERTNDLPTPSPTPSPTWQIRSQLQSSTGTAVGYGAAVALADNLLVVGAPDFAESGQVQTLQQSSSPPLSFSPVTVDFESNTADYGTALDMTVDTNGNPLLIVGAATSAGAVETGHVFGTAHVYTFSSSGWQPSGNIIRGPETVRDTFGQCGEAVAVSSVGRVAVSCPSTSELDTRLNTGAVHIMEQIGSTWTPMNASPVTGDPQSYTGQSIDMSDDGTKLLVGAPGNSSVPVNGKVVYYSLDPDSNTWTEVFSFDGSNSESLGSSVQIITPDGDQFAVASQNGGVRVFGFNNETQDYEQQVISGSGATDLVGAVLAGSGGKVAVGTEAGRIRVYEYDGSSWNQLGDSPNPGSPILSLAMSTDARVLAAGMADVVVVYERT